MFGVVVLMVVYCVGKFWLLDVIVYFDGLWWELVMFVVEYFFGVVYWVFEVMYIGWIEMSVLGIDGLLVEFFWEYVGVVFMEGWLFGCGYEEFVWVVFVML